MDENQVNSLVARARSKEKNSSLSLECNRVRSKFKEKWKTDKSNYCKKKCHQKFYYPKLKEKKKKSDNIFNAGDSASVAEDYSDGTKVLLISISSSEDVWILNSA